MFSLTLSIVALVLALYSLGLLIRNAWVFERRIELNRFENGAHVIRSYADYDTMMRKFWVWDVEKFKMPNARVNSVAVGDPATERSES
jgi:hypothetical protein